MQNLADAIIYLLAYLNLAGRDSDTGHTIDCNRDDDECKALEWVATLLDSATAAERFALRAAVERAVTQEGAGAEPRYEWLACYEDILTELDEHAASTNSHLS